MIAAERRTRRDLVVAAALVAVVAVLAGVVWVRSDARATTSIQAAVPFTALLPETTLPSTLSQAWSAPSGATRTPVVAAGAVVTGDGSGVQGRDPATGAVRWSYTRDLPLCAVAAQWSRAVAVYRDGAGCSQVTSLDGDTGARGPQRSSEADDEVILTGDGTYLVSTGSTRLEAWRSDLVRTLELGRVEALVSPGIQPRAGCTFRAALTVPSVLSLLASCPDRDEPQLILLDPAPDDAAKPLELSPTPLPLLTGPGAKLLAVSPTAEAVLLPQAAGGPQVQVFSTTGARSATYAVPVSAAEVAALGEGPLPQPVSTGAVTTVAVGSTLLALDPKTLELAWSTQGVLGSGALFAGSLLVPVPGGISALDATTGAVGATIAVDRGADTGPVSLAAAGAQVLEQRGDTLVALG